MTQAPRRSLSPVQENAHRHRLAGRWPDAEAAYRRLLALDPDDRESGYFLALCLQEQGRVQDAVIAYRNLIEKQPDHADAFNNLGVAFKSLGRLEDAVACYRQAARLRPDHAATLSNLGNAMKALGKGTEAEDMFRAAILAKPDSAEIHNSLGALLQELDRLDEAEIVLRKALALKPDYPSALNYLGMVLQEQDRMDDAIAHYLRALAFDPEYAEAHNNLGFAMRRLGRLDEATGRYGLAFVFKPDFRQAAMNRALVELACGEFEVGWDDYRLRPLVRRDVVAIPDAPLPQDLSGRFFILLKEQGLGDELFFLRFAPLLKARGADFAVEASPKIARILGRVPGFDRIVADESARTLAGEKIYQGDLPYLLGAEDAAHLPPPLVLTPLPERVEHWRAQLSALGPAPYTGITWRGGVKGAGKLFKQVPLDLLGQAFGGISGTPIAVQRHPLPGEVDKLGQHLGRSLADLTAANDDLEDMLALLSLLDRYATVSNTNVHLRAGVAKTCHVLVPHPSEFRWLVEGSRSPWFPDFPVYRQSVDGDWTGAIEAIGRDLGSKH